MLDETGTEGPDHRIYVPHNDCWTAVVKPNSIKEYCYYRSPGEEHFHLLMVGEVYLARGDEKVCLNCAMRQGLVSTDRVHWQRAKSPRKLD